jgi:hypothetical protein
MLTAKSMFSVIFLSAWVLTLGTIAFGSGSPLTSSGATNPASRSHGTRLRPTFAHTANAHRHAHFILPAVADGQKVART